jgi:alanine dehydrogenase
MVKKMKPGSVIVDVAVDQGGCIETIHETTHNDPVYELHGVLHYAVGNMPGAVPHTSTYALTNVTIRYARALAGKGPEEAARTDRALALGFNTFGGHVTYEAVARDLELGYRSLESLLK